MMATAAVIGLSTGKRFLSSSFYYSDISDKFSNVNDHGLAHYQFASMKNVIVSRKSSKYSPSFPFSNQQEQSIRALKEHVDTASDPSTTQPWFQESNDLEEETSQLGYSVEALLLLQKSMLEKQWNLSFEGKVLPDLPREKSNKKTPITCSGVSARQRRMTAKKRTSCKSSCIIQPSTAKHVRAIISPELLQNRLKGYVKGVISEELLTHSEVVWLSKKIKIGLSLEQQKSR